MNARSVKKGKKMFTKAQIAEALNTVLEINEDETSRVAFFGYAGHTQGLQIDVYPLGWDSSDKSKDYHISYLDYADMDHYEGKTYRGKRNTEFVIYNSFNEMMEAVRKVGV